MTASRVSKSRLRSFTDIAKFLPKNRAGKKVAVSTLHRWRLRGSGGLKLQCVKTPSGFKTSLKFVHEFFARLTALEQTSQTTTSRPREREARNQQHQDRVARQLEAMGIRTLPKTKDLTAEENQHE